MSSERIGPGLRAVVRLDESGQECRRGEPLTPEALERKIQRLDRSAPVGPTWTWKLTPQGWTVVGIVGVLLTAALIKVPTRRPTVSLPSGPSGSKLPAVAPRESVPGRPGLANLRPEQPREPQAEPDAPLGPPGLQPEAPGAGTAPEAPKPEASPAPKAATKPSTLAKAPATTKRSTRPAPIREVANSLGMRFAPIARGEFLMGADDDDPNRVTGGSGELPQHRVRITRPFYLGLHEVTQSEYARVLGRNLDASGQSGQLPVVDVSWFDAIHFCNELSRWEGLDPFYLAEEGGGSGQVTVIRPAGLGYRLPTEAEWEYACRANAPAPATQTPFSFGSDPANLFQFAWYDRNSEGRLHPVATRTPNRYGLFDMHGNVWEWCWDWHDATYYAASPPADPLGPSRGQAKVRRGGSWNLSYAHARSAFRAFGLPTDHYIDIGFRVARNAN